MDEKLKTLHELCDTISRELADANEKIRKAGGKLSAGDVDYVDKLTHSLKSIKTTIAMMEADDEGGYSNRYMPHYGYAYNDGRGNGYAPRRDSMGRYSREDRNYSRGYSYADELDGIVEEMRAISDKLPEEHRRKVERALHELR